MARPYLTATRGQMNQQPHNYQVGADTPDPRPSQPMTTFELRMKEIQDRYQQRTAEIDRDFNRHVKRILLKAAIFLILSNLALGVIWWLLSA